MGVTTKEEIQTSFWFDPLSITIQIMIKNLYLAAKPVSLAKA